MRALQEHVAALQMINNNDRNAHEGSQLLGALRVLGGSGIQ
jgi:hypothetical protein